MTSIGVSVDGAPIGIDHRRGDTLSPPAHQLRLADASDAQTVRQLDDLVFAPGRLDQQRADPGELEAGVDNGDIYLLILNGEPVGYLHADRSEPGRIYVAGVAIRPDVQGKGLGTALIDHMLSFLGDQRDQLPVVTVTSPANLVMLKTLFRKGFSARWFMADHFGPGHHRFGCQLLNSGRAGSGPADRQATHRGPAVWVPVTEVATIRRMMNTEGFRVRSHDGTTPSARFELVRTLPGDFLPAEPPGHFTDARQTPMLTSESESTEATTSLGDGKR